MAIRALVIPWQKATSWQMPISRTWQEHQHLSWFLTPYNSLDFGVNQDRGSSIESLNQHLSNKKRIIEILYHRSHIWITFRFLILIWLRFPPTNAKINSNLAHLNCPFWIGSRKAQGSFDHHSTGRAWRPWCAWQPVEQTPLALK